MESGEENLKNNKVFEVLQRVGRSFMLPIAILPVAGLFLGIGSSFTNETMLKAYGLYGIMGPGTIIHGILTVMSAAGSIVFDNLPLLFAIGVAIGMAKREKEVAALASVIAFFIMHTAISALISVNYAGGDMSMDAMEQAVVNLEQNLGLSGATSMVLGIYTLNMGVFGGIIVGLGTAALHNRFYKIQLPQVLSFFGGTRFVPIISAVVFLLVFYLAVYSKSYFNAWKSRTEYGLYRYTDLRNNRTCVNTIRTSSCILYAVLADKCRRLNGDCRSDNKRCTKYILCTACRP